MFSKRMVISMIVVGCLVQFMTCTPEKIQSQSPNSPPRRLAGSKPSPSTTKPSAGRPNSLSKPRAVLTPNNVGPKGNTPTRNQQPLSRRPTGPKKPEAVNKNVNNIPENEESDEQPVSGFRKFFGKLKGIRKYVCPFKIARRIYGKSKRLRSRIMKSIGIKSTSNDNGENSDP
ncbi:uncharacterized protein LOC113549396 [Rhopalosiphum maidis]|uniref:uncharacterized protein LOC113549396 n=1 Tax=Rhopalosiphum maidis TaxID=43146 RepID=UPI000F0037B7|nr:uncharacterized protein LOC113549396 [Rhopalosiphum maidis]